MDPSRGESASNYSEEALGRLCAQLASLSTESPADAWPRQRIDACANGGVFRWFTPESHGGWGWNAAQTSDGFYHLSGACLTTTFILTQLTGACRRIANCDNQALRTQLLPDLASGRHLATLGISHMTTSRQHLGRPALTATEDDGGYVLNGMSPWVTGASEVEGMLVGAELADRRQLLAHIRLSAPGITIEPPSDLVALSGSKTGAVRLKDVRVSEDQLLSAPREQIMKSGVGASTGGLQTSTLALGLASSAVTYISNEAALRADLEPAATQLRSDLESNLSTLRTLAKGNDSKTTCTAAELRANSNSLVLRATQAALVAAKGAGFVDGHKAGRWCREALFFLVWSCPQPVRSASLCEFARIE